MTARGEVRQAGDGPRILVTVGTDHHPFDRLIAWTNAWLERHPDCAGAVYVQSGAASVAPACPGSRFLGADRLGVLFDSADVIVCHGGPASIAEAWARGHVPIVVPREPALGEHVDDHQVEFCRKVAQAGRISLARTPAGFCELLDQAARDPAQFRADVPVPDIDAAVARFGELVDDLVSRPASRWHPIGRRRRGESERTGFAGKAPKEHE